MQSRLILALIIFFVLFSLLPTGYELVNRHRLPPQRAFELVHNFPTDYNFYLSRIRQGMEGATTVVERYTGEPHEGSFIQVFYLELGWLGRWWRVPADRAGDVYHVARIVFGITLLVLMWQFAKRQFSLFRISLTSYLLPLTSYLLAVTASTWPKLVLVDGIPRFGGYMPWWSVMDSLQRITFIPHLLAGQSIILALLLLLTDEKAMTRGGSWVFVGLLGFTLGLIFPPGLLFVYVTVGILFLVYRRNFVPFSVFILLSAPSLGYLQLMTTFYPWKRLTEVDIIRPLPFDYIEYFKAVGPVLPLGLVGLLMALVRKEKSMAVAASWVAAWLFLLLVFKFVPQQSPLRFSEMLPHVPLAVLTAYVCWVTFQCSYWGFGHWKLFGSWFLVLGSYVLLGIRLVFRIIPVLLLVLGLGTMLSSWWWQRDFINHKIRATYPLVPTGSYVMYPLKDFIAAIRFLQDHTPADAVVLSETTAGNYTPAYSSRRVYLGHDNTVGYEQKQAVAKRFFSGSMKAEEAKLFLDANRIRWVFFGPQEKEDLPAGRQVDDFAKVYPFLTEVYTNPHVTIYRL